MHYLSERIRKDKNFTAKKQIVIDNQIKIFPGKQFAVDSGTTSQKWKTYYSLPYIRHFSLVTKKKLRHLRTFLKWHLISTLRFPVLRASMAYLIYT